MRKSVWSPVILTLSCHLNAQNTSDPARASIGGATTPDPKGNREPGSTGDWERPARKLIQLTSLRVSPHSNVKDGRARISWSMSTSGDILSSSSPKLPKHPKTGVSLGKAVRGGNKGGGTIVVEEGGTGMVVSQRCWGERCALCPRSTLLVSNGDGEVWQGPSLTQSQPGFVWLRANLAW